MGCIYKITNTINGKIYIGKTVRTADERFREHRTDSSGRFKDDTHLYRSMNKYGKNNFIVEVLYECDGDDKLNILEKFFIRKLNSRDRDIGYNMTEGGDGFGSGENNPLYGKRGEDSCNFGTKRSEKTKEKMRKAFMERPDFKKLIEGRPYSPEHVEKMRVKTKQYWQTDEGKRRRKENSLKFKKLHSQEEFNLKINS